MKLRYLALASAALLAVSAQAQDSVLVIHAGQLLDKPGSAAKGPSTIIVKNGKIAEIQSGYQAGPDGATTVDLKDKFVLPGLIDSHVHLESDAGGNAGLIESITSSHAATAYRAAGNAKKTLLAGFTTVRNLGDNTGATLALRDTIAAGDLPGPRIIDAGDSISTTSGHMDGKNGIGEDLHNSISDDNLCDGTESYRQAVRKQIRRGVDVIKIATTGGVNSRIGVGVGRQIFDDEVKALVDTAHLYGKKVAVHAR